jgi:Zn-finger nucleic acid-binding protein
MARWYLSCPDCHVRMKRTGKKSEVGRTIDGEPVYCYEFECPRCRGIFVFDVMRNFMRRGSLE